MSSDVDELLKKAKWEGKGQATRQKLVNKIQGIHFVDNNIEINYIILTIIYLLMVKYGINCNGIDII